ncbi:MAG: hypothetical protein SFX73_19795 [Kofleriaceae bacterium]|nr:hypothetical protein [Kofleriaceae bacterium]
MDMHHRVRGAILGTIAALCLPRAVFAQGPEDTPPEGDTAEQAPGAIAPTPSELSKEPPAKVEPKRPVADAAPHHEPPATPTMTPGIDPKKWTFQPYGYLRMQYRLVQNDPNVAFVGRNDGFELQNARFGMRAVLSPRLAMVVAAEGAVDERLEVNVPEGRMRLALRDAFADVGLSGQLLVRAGYFVTWFDPDLDDDIRRAFVDRPIESRGVRATQGFQTGGLTPGRSLGAALRLDPPAPSSGATVGFELAVQNGSDEYSTSNDNDTPAASASLVLRMPKGNALVASGRFNRRTEGELPLRRDEDDFEGSAGTRLMFGPVWLAGGVVFRRTTFPTTGGPVQNGYGAHAQLVIRIPGDTPMTVGYRFGVLDASSLVLTDRVMEHTAGGSLALPKLHMRFQLQAVHAVEQGARTLTNDRVQLAAEVVL